MAINNQAGDMFNPPSNLSQDFEEYYFGDLEVGELFWETDNPKDERYQKTAWRKVSQSEGRNLKNQKIFSFPSKTKVFQKT